ncbi:hypothetical protein Anas_10712 [Armadillidium nasatum]|uniref:Uncharacterized protein n=1 Tax=Armadillidium nasatum TaxID=96803 RepID=A0A5N5SMY7_9CRUS|nr:hypothetical protein Anas_10712 [Armadillidium nasatum]
MISITRILWYMLHSVWSNLKLHLFVDNFAVYCRSKQSCGSTSLQYCSTNN